MRGLRSLGKRQDLTPKVVLLVSKGMGIALVPRALTDSGIARVRFLPIPQSRYVSNVYCIWNERQMPSVLPALLEAFRD